MKSRSIPFLLASSFLILFATVQLVAQTVNVTMRINTSTCPDTLKSNHFVYLCGETTTADGAGTTPAITWSTGTTGLKATNIGGDYWEAKFQAKVGETIKYKFVTMFDASTNTAFNWGWEGNFANTEQRRLVVGSNDTTLAMQYYHGTNDLVDQYWKPFETKEDSVAIYFRVNMGGADFNPATQKVDVRGGLPMGGADSWITIKTLSHEVNVPNALNGDPFWSGVAYVAKAALTPGTQQKFRFVIQPNTWEVLPADRAITFNASTSDTTIHWSYFSNLKPGVVKVSANILFRLKLDALEKAGMFNRALGDKVGITGAKAWAVDPFDFDTDTTVLKMTYNSDLEEWNLLESFSKFPGEVIPYKYYIAWDTSRVDSTSQNFIRGLALSNGWEEPGVTGGADRNYVYSDQTEQFVTGDFGAEQQFFNSLHPNGVIKTPITVTFSIDMRPATSEVTNTTSSLFRPGIDTAYVQFDGSLLAVTQGKTMYGTDNRIMLADTDGDGIYTGTMDLNPPAFNQACYRISYTTTGGITTNGGGNLKGRRYYQYIKPTSISPVVWPSTYQFATMEWKSQDLTVEDAPDLGPVTDVEDEFSGIPSTYSLKQNYPNPFNPTTVITYTIPEKVDVKIEVFNILGQRIATLFNNEQAAGTHMLEWNSRNDFGMNVTSGVYLLKLQAGTFTQVKKMLLVR